VPIALLIGITGGLGLAFGVESYLDHSFTNGDEIERRLGLVHVASIPDGACGG
jgi:capsular polysaccharide biosynthesis protein